MPCAAACERVIAPAFVAGSAALAPLRWWHLASLDAPTVAVSWSEAFAWAAGVRLPLWVPVLIALAVWSVYVADRLLDAKAELRAARLDRLRERHLFHWRHRRLFAPMAFAGAFAAACIFFAAAPAAVREHDSLLAAASLVYFAGVHTGRKTPLLPKEFLVGMLFTAGCLLPTWSRTAFPTPAAIWLALVPAVFFALLAWLNCFTIDRWERGLAAATARSVALPAVLLGAAGIVLAVALSVQQQRCAALVGCGAAAALLLALLDRLRARLGPVVLRAAADLVLLTPIALVPFAARLAR